MLLDMTSNLRKSRENKNGHERKQDTCVKIQPLLVYANNDGLYKSKLCVSK